MSVLGYLLPGILHELNNPLSYVLSNLETIEEYLDTLLVEGVSDEVLLDAKDALSDTREGLVLLPELSRSLRLYLGTPLQVHKPVVLDKIVTHALLLSHNRLKYTIEVERKQAELTWVQGDGMLLCRAVVYILLNAAQSIQEKGKVCVSTELFDDKIKLVVSDNGCGILTEPLRSVLKPGVSCWAEQSVENLGGMGLSIVAQIVEEHRGEIQLSRHEPQGTSVAFILPVFREQR